MLALTTPALVECQGNALENRPSLALAATCPAITGSTSTALGLTLSSFSSSFCELLHMNEGEANRGADALV